MLKRKYQYLAIIPARSGSKGIRNKNMIDLCGQPLIKYSIDACVQALKNNNIDELFISTDGGHIKDYVEGVGIQVPVLRPQEIAEDNSKTIDVILHALEYFNTKKVSFDAVLLCQPTSPLRTYSDIHQSIQLFESNDSESLISVYQEDYINALVMYKSQSGLGVPLDGNHNKGIRRQEHGEVFVRNGAIYITSVDYLLKTKQIISDRPVLYEMKKSDSINVDTIEDIELLKKII